MCFFAKQSRLRVYPTIVIDTIIITKAEEKFLGLHIDKQLGWDICIKHILGMVSSGISTLIRL